MNFRFAGISVIALFTTLVASLVTLPAVAEDVDFSSIKCSDFVADSKDDAILLLTWLEGYFTKKNAPPIMNSQKAVADARNIHDYCLAHGDDTLFRAAQTTLSVK